MLNESIELEKICLRQSCHNIKFEALDESKSVRPNVIEARPKKIENQIGVKKDAIVFYPSALIHQVDQVVPLSCS